MGFELLHVAADSEHESKFQRFHRRMAPGSAQPVAYAVREHACRCGLRPRWSACLEWL